MEAVVGTTKSCYIHIPFCKKICSYCDFCKVFYNEKYVKNYLNSLEKEIKEKYQGEKLETIYIGGGTPSVLSIDELKYLFKIISIFHKEDKYELTIECNFDSLTKDKLLLFKENGVNRLSLGLQTTDYNVLNKLNRDLDLKYVKELIRYSKSIGLNNINIDLMYAFPFSNMDILKQDIEFILSLDIKHISTYSLIIEKNTKLYIDNIKNISEDIDLEMYNYIHNKLIENGYRHYEISNFAKEKYQSKHNLVYWKNKSYYGFGLSASSYINNERITNTRSITKYINNNIDRTVEQLNINDKMVYEMILGLRLDEGVSLEQFYLKYNKRITEVFNIEELIKNKYLVIEDDHLKVPFDKWYVINSILVSFLEVNNG
ncbi:MAG: radical SAM family heme chaperone HemW [Bacilli bacterium]|nr:radical SAM family heme chaperone HemW [Bacilli bacterium]